MPCSLQVFHAARVLKLHRGQLLGQCERGGAAMPVHDHPGARDQYRQREPGALGANTKLTCAASHGVVVCLSRAAAQLPTALLWAWGAERCRVALSRAQGLGSARR